LVALNGSFYRRPIARVEASGRRRDVRNHNPCGWSGEIVGGVTTLIINLMVLAENAASDEVFFLRSARDFA